MDISKLSQTIESFAPLTLQEEWDNSGWQLKLSDNVNRVLVCLEITPDTLNEAVSKECDVIITHHPLIFSSLTALDVNKASNEMIISLIKHGISVYSSHTPFDKAKGGNNDYFGNMLGLTNIMPLSQDDLGYMRTGSLHSPCNLNDFIDFAADATSVDGKLFKYIGNPNLSLSKICWCTGAGAEFMALAKETDCDLYITGDVKYHEARFANEIGLNVLDMGHFATENHFRINMADVLKNSLRDDDIEILISEKLRNPFIL